jgi:hypothetical protein
MLVKTKIYKLHRQTVLLSVENKNIQALMKKTIYFIRKIQFIVTEKQ